MYKIEVGTITFASDGTDMTCSLQDGRSASVPLSSDAVDTTGERVCVLFKDVGVVVSLTQDEWAYLKDGTPIPEPELVLDEDDEAPAAPAKKKRKS